MSSKTSKHRSKRSSHTKSWSDWLYDEQLGWYKTRKTASGVTEYQYDRPQTQQPVPRSDSVQPPTLRQESSNWDNYPAQTTSSNPTYPSANITSHTPLNTSAETTYSATSVYNSTHGYETSDTATVEGRMQNMRISGAAPPLPNTTYTNNPIPTSGPPQQALKSDSRFEIINDGRKFFKVGRVFKMMWAEPAGSNARDDSFVTTSSMGEKVYSKVRHFVVVKEQKGCCSCAPLNTYGSQGTNKRGVTPGDHAAVYDSKKSKPPSLPRENLKKDPFPIIVEAVGEVIDPMSRINFGRVHTIEHNFKVMKVGRIPTEHIPRLQRYFVECFIGGTASNLQESSEENNTYQSAPASTPSNSYSDSQSYASPSSGYGMATTGYGNAGDWNLSTSAYNPSAYGSTSGYPPPPPATSYYGTTYRAAAGSDQPQPQPPTPSPSTGYPTVPYESTATYTPAYDTPQYPTGGYSTTPAYTNSYGGGQSTGYYAAQSSSWDQTPLREDKAVADITTVTPSWQGSTRRDKGKDPDRRRRR